jgi:hypothetical protein
MKRLDHRSLGLLRLLIRPKSNPEKPAQSQSRQKEPRPEQDCHHPLHRLLGYVGEDSYVHVVSYTASSLKCQTSRGHQGQI